ncbi:MAG: hypothetical protein IKZ02_04915, partial [Alphaproteobacteria bacterium]|nr:hypothetical protein [Alphaproteobacteria bacterium]
YTLRDLLDKGYSAEAIRFELIKAHYRMTMDFQENNLKGNQTVIDKLSNLMSRLDEPKTGTGWEDCAKEIDAVLTGFEKGLDDDLNMPIALASVFDFISSVNKNFDTLSLDDAQKIKDVILKLDTVLALLPEKKDQKLTAEQEALIQKRQEYRLSKDWANADAVKQQLLEMGIIVKDTPNGPVWTIQ